MLAVHALKRLTDARPLIILNGTRKESLLDHVYVDDISLIQNLSYNEPTFGDHLLVITELILRNVVEQKTITRRDWRNYTRMGLICNLLFRDGLDTLNVQAMWNSIEHSIIVATDLVAPVVTSDCSKKLQLPILTRS